MKYSIVRRYSMEFKTVSRSVESVMKDVQKGKIYCRWKPAHWKS